MLLVIKKNKRESDTMDKMNIHLSSTNKMLGGVCGGLAESIGIDATIVRILAMALLIFTHAFIVIAYIALWAILPRE